MNQAKTPTFLFQWSDFFFNQIHSIGCSFKFILKVGVEKSIVNAPLVSLYTKNINNAKSEVRFKQLIGDL
jgi:hypothetical protein